jgi:hypothetical protein
METGGAVRSRARVEADGTSPIGRRDGSAATAGRALAAGFICTSMPQRLQRIGWCSHWDGTLKAALQPGQVV